MSTILKALRRLESDKNSQVRRPLRQEVVGGSEPRRRFPILWVAAAVFAAGIAIGAAALFLWPADFLGSRTGAPAASPSVVAADAPTSRAAVPEPDRERPARPPPRSPDAPAAAAAAAPAAPDSEPDVAVVRQVSPTPLRVQSESEPRPPPRPPGPGEVRPGAEALKPRPRPPALKSTPVAAAGAAQPARETLARPQPAALPPQPAAPPEAPEPQPRASVAPQPRPEPEAEIAPPPEPQLPVQRRAGVPVILVSRTLWHPRPERREALIEVEMEGGSETRRVREGDAVGSLIVERIEPSGVVFDYDGVELRHAVGSGP